MFWHNHLNQNNDQGRHFELSYVFAMSKVRVHSYVRYSQLLESTKNFCLQYSLRYLSSFERVVIALGLFISSLFIRVLTLDLFGLWNVGEKHTFMLPMHYAFQEWNIALLNCLHFLINYNAAVFLMLDWLLIYRVVL